MGDYVVIGGFIAIGILFIGVIGYLLSRETEESRKQKEVENASRSVLDGNVDEIKPEVMRTFLETFFGHNLTHAKHDVLTKFELHWMFWRLKADLPGCPDCETGQLAEGSSAFATTTIKCMNNLCGSKFLMHGAGIGIVRLTDRSPDKPLEMVSMGPHR